MSHQQPPGWRPQQPPQGYPPQQHRHQQPQSQAYPQQHPQGYHHGYQAQQPAQHPGRPTWVIPVVIGAFLSLTIVVIVLVIGLAVVVSKPHARAERNRPTRSPAAPADPSPPAQVSPPPRAQADLGDGHSETFPSVVQRFNALGALKQRDKQKDFSAAFKGKVLSGSGEVNQVGECGWTDDSSKWGRDCIRVKLFNDGAFVDLYYPKNRENVAGYYSKGKQVTFDGCVGNSITDWGTWSTATCDMP